jgi:Ufm1-specific protease 2
VRLYLSLIEPLRKNIHDSFSIPLDKPYFRRVDAFQFSSTNKSPAEINSAYLRNPHTSAKPSGIQNGKQTFVQGDYVYFHYMQDFNDNGWGCAYRSFQTIFSWFKLQNFTNLSVPTHRDIQQALYEIGDKPRDFIGSSKWIGSMEISFCLSKILNVESKIISVSSGSELSEKAREIQYHFETEGTPVKLRLPFSCV